MIDVSARFKVCCSTMTGTFQHFLLVEMVCLFSKAGQASRRIFLLKHLLADKFEFGHMLLVIHDLFVV